MLAAPVHQSQLVEISAERAFVRHHLTANNSVQDPQWHSALPTPVVFKVGHERRTPHCPMGLRAFWSRACKTRPSDLGRRCAELCTFLLPAERMHKSCSTRICLTVNSSSNEGKRLPTLNRSQKKKRKKKGRKEERKKEKENRKKRGVGKGGGG